MREEANQSRYSNACRFRFSVWFRWLIEVWDPGDDHVRQRLQSKLFEEKVNAVAPGFSVERMRRFIELHLFRFADNRRMLLRHLRRQAFFLIGKLEKHDGRSGMGNVFAL